MPTAKIRTLKAAKHLRQGHLIAHHTSTLPGMAASAYSAAGIKRLQRFKQRKAPFLLLADSVRTALQQAVYISPHLRHLAKQSWVGSTTLVFPAKQRLHTACYHRGCIAIRVDADVETRRLAKLSGGLLLSSSLNRKGKAVQQSTHKMQYRWKRHLTTAIKSQQSAKGKASQIFKISGSKKKQIR